MYCVRHSYRAVMNNTFPQPNIYSVTVQLTRSPLMYSPLACLIVQPAGPPFCAARQPAENSRFSFGNTALQPAQTVDPPFSVIHNC